MAQIPASFRSLTTKAWVSMLSIGALAGGAIIASPAWAVAPTVSIGTPTGAGVNGNGVVTTESAVTVPITLNGFGAATNLDVKISVPVGEGYFSVDAGTTSIAADVGYTDSTEVTEYAFNGTVADVTSVLSSGVSWVAPATSAGDITVSVAQTEAGLYFNHDNGHYYKPVNDSNVTWSQAVDYSDNTTKYGMVGYLATVTSRQENNFITYNTTTSSMWLGGSDAGGSNGSSYTWRTGPESGQQFWSGGSGGSVPAEKYAGWTQGEPSNDHYFWACGFLCIDDDYENNTVINWEERGRWNDLMSDPTKQEFNNDHVDWYLIEYGGMGSDVPTALIAETTETLVASDSVRSGTVSSGVFTTGTVNAAWENTNPKTFAIDLQRFENTSASELAVTLSLPASSGTFTVPVTTGLSLETGYTSFTEQTDIGFVGAKADVITALGNLRWNPPSTFGSFTATVSVAEKESGIFYNPDNGHYYQVKTWGSDTNFGSANTFANAQIFAGMTGYIATITSDAENDFIAEHTTAANAWIGASDSTGPVNNVADQRFGDQEGNWHWITGPEGGNKFYEASGGGSTVNGLIESWASGEPNNYSTWHLSGTTYENYAVTNRGGNPGLWNDVEYDMEGVRAAIIEYGGLPTEPNKSKSVVSELDFYHVIAPASPTLSDVSGEDESITATLTDGSGNGANITNHQYSVDGGTTWTGISEDLATTNGDFTVSGLTNGTAYSLCVRAYNWAGWGTASACETVVPSTTADAPVLSDVRPRNAGFRALVTPGNFNGGDAVTTWAYQLDAGVWTDFATNLTFDGYLTVAAGLTNGQTYSVCVRGTNSQGPSASSNCVNVTPTTPGLPGAPTIDSVTVDGTTATMIVTESANDGAADLTTYEYSTNGGETWTLAPENEEAPIPRQVRTGESTTYEWTISGLREGARYDFAVRVTNSAGFSAMSEVINVKVPNGSGGNGGNGGSGGSSNGSGSNSASAVTDDSRKDRSKPAATATPEPEATQTPAPKPTEEATESAESGTGDILNQVAGTLGWIVALLAAAGAVILVRSRRRKN